MTENEKFIDNPEILKVTQPTLPTFFGNAEDWVSYVGRLDYTDYVNMVIRFRFLRYLLLDYKFTKQSNVAFNNFLEDKQEIFKETDDFKYLTKSRIYGRVDDDLNHYGEGLLEGIAGYL